MLRAGSAHRLLVVVIVMTLDDHSAVDVVAIVPFLDDPAVTMPLDDDRSVVAVVMLLDHLSSALAVAWVHPDPARPELD